jgi:superfamily II DNA or RNA helicase/diadenosine tetraphosphate (Ap4A) HIT family hydrolase/SOS-response transcriptional repressor LexA
MTGDPNGFSVFLQRPRNEWVAHNDLAFAIRDGFPVSPGHTLVIPFREVLTWFEATPEERTAIFDLVLAVKAGLDEELKPTGYNVGFNAGTAAGQTVPHLHVHVIPRYDGDVPDPTGGIRHVIPGKGNYRVQSAPPLATGGVPDPFLAHVAPLFERADHVDIVAAFVQDSGLLLLHDAVHRAVARGCRIRLVTGDYLAITQERALRRLVAWTFLAAGGSDLDDEAGRGTVRSAGTFAARVVETARLDPPGTSFHPKAWIFEGPGLASAFVGSSNVSHSALKGGVEWNLRADRQAQPAAYARVREAFDDLWLAASPLTAEWVSGYAARARATAVAPVPGEVVPDARPSVPEPHRLQLDGIASLARARKEGRGRSLVVMATGLGKTWLAAFDLAAVSAELGRFPRVLFLAHRAEILEQAADTFGILAESRGFDPRVSWYAGDGGDLDGDLVFASVQKLSRADGLSRLTGQRFDYAVVDEVHHAAAASYRRILDRLDAGFVLGLTATPDRADAADVRGLFDDHVAYEAGLAEGIEEGRLAPFSYFGLRDTVDYEDIPWRNARFDPEALATAAATEARMDRLWQAWDEHPGTRTLVFCCSVAHARFVVEWLSAKGLRVRAVTAESDEASRSGAREDLRQGRLDALCAVDLFNEGVDLPTLDRIVMLRPTESPVVFVQQLGRGLRRADGKESLTVIDFVGNHRVFLDRLRLLLSLGRKPVALRAFLEDQQTVDLPPGCSVEVELEAIEMLRFLLPRGETETIRVYRELKAARGERPTAGELCRMGVNLPKSGWFPLVEQEGDLDEDARRVHAACREWFLDLQTTHIQKSFKMVLLEALLEAGALRTGLDVAELAERSRKMLRRSPELARDMEGVAELGGVAEPDGAAWVRYWRRYPVKAWTEGPQRRWFRLDEDRLSGRFPIPEGLDDVFEAMTRELVDFRLALYRRRSDLASDGPAFTCKVLWNRRDPILKLPTRSSSAVPDEEADVRLPDGSVWSFRFMKEYCNVARPAGRDRNELPDLLRGWFGPAAGRPGTDFHVRFFPSPDGLCVEPAGAARVLSFPSRTLVTAYPSLRAAAGAARRDSFADEEAGPDSAGETVTLPISKPVDRLFAVRASGSSMDGGTLPIRDGDWVVLRWARGEALKNLHATRKVALVETAGSSGDGAYQLKRIVREEGRWLLRSDNPAVPDFEATEENVPIAVHVETIRPEDLAPAPGTAIPVAGLADAFGLHEPPTTGRVEGHLFLLVEEKGTLAAPDRVRFPIARNPGETTFVLARTSPDADWRFSGVGRWLENESLWAIPEVDWPTWHALGTGRTASRRLPPELEAEARELVRTILEKAAPDGSLPERDGRTFRALRVAPQGGLRIDGGPNGFAERTVSVTDLGWILAARKDVALHGGILDEARVNRLRYLEGTPRAATRWIDTGNAIWLVRMAEEK